VSKTFLAQEKHIRCAIDRPDEPAKEWITLDELKTKFPPELLPAATALHLFDNPEEKKKLIQAQQSIREGIQELKEGDDKTVFKGPSPTI